MNNYTVGFNRTGIRPGYYSETVEGDRLEAARMLLDSFSNNFSFAPEIFKAIAEWLATDAEALTIEPAAGFVYYIEPVQGRTLRPVTFCFADDMEWKGFTDDTFWNGFLNIEVTRRELTKMINYFVNQCGYEDGCVESFEDIEPDDFGMYSLANGFATSEVETTE